MQQACQLRGRALHSCMSDTMVMVSCHGGAFG
jgi:hypothetical protein